MASAILHTQQQLNRRLDRSLDLELGGPAREAFSELEIYSGRRSQQALKSQQDASNCRFQRLVPVCDKAGSSRWEILCFNCTFIGSQLVGWLGRRNPIISIQAGFSMFQRDQGWLCKEQTGSSDCTDRA